MMIKLLISIAMLILIITTGFVREFVFVNINEQMRFLWFQSEPSQMSSVLNFLSNWTYWQLYYLKWILTLGFTLVFFGETILLARYALGNWFIKEIAFLYVALFALSGFIFTFYYIFSDANDGYLIARYLMGMAQSPVPAMIIIPALYLRTSLKPKVSQ